MVKVVVMVKVRGTVIVKVRYSTSTMSIFI